MRFLRALAICVSLFFGSGSALATDYAVSFTVPTWSGFSAISFVVQGHEPVCSDIVNATVEAAFQNWLAANPNPSYTGHHVVGCYNRSPTSLISAGSSLSIETKPSGSGGSGIFNTSGRSVGVYTPTCENGATDYPTCSAPTCANGATDYPTCTPPTCANGATNYPSCTTFPTCSNGATNYPSCTTFPTCSNGANDYPACQSCPEGKTMVNGVCAMGAGEAISWGDPAQMGQGLFIGVLALLFAVGVFAGQQR